MKKLKNYTTQISSHQTVGEIQQLLVEHGAKKIALEYTDEGYPYCIGFFIEVNGEKNFFQIECKVDGIQKILIGNNPVKDLTKTKKQSFNIGWRTIKQNIESGIELLRWEMQTPKEVFQSYLKASGDQLKIT